jgi:hypothetical protein
MSIFNLKLLRNRSLMLYIYTSAIIIGFAYYTFHLYAYGYLPTPFVSDKSNTFMDLFNPLYWAEVEGQYEIWKSVYPPLNFVILKAINHLFGDYFYPLPPYVIRDSGKIIIYFFLFLYLMIPFILLNTTGWKSIAKNTWQKTFCFFAIVLSTPMLFALERGNLILICLLFLPIAISPNQILRMFGIAILINLKPYFLILGLIYFFDRRYIELLMCAITTAAIFMISSVILDTDFTTVWLNIFHLSQKSNFFPIRELLSFPVALSTLKSSLPLLLLSDNAPPVEMENLILSGTRFLTYFQYFCISIVIVSFILKRNKFSSAFQLFALIVIIVNISVMIGPYSLIYYIPFVPFIFYFKYVSYYFLAILLLFLPLDIVVLQSHDIGIGFVYLAQSDQNLSWQLGMGSLLRPLLNLFLLIVITLESMQHYQLKFAFRAQ